MRSGNVLFSAIHLFVVFFILATGLFFIALPYSTNVRFFLSDLLIQKPSIFTKMGSGILILGSILFVGFYVMNRRRFLQLKMESSKALIDHAIIHEYVEKYWKELFPKNDVHSEVVIRGNQKLEIIADFPSIPDKDKEELLQRIQNELGVLLARRLGYEKEFLLTIADTI